MFRFNPENVLKKILKITDQEMRFPEYIKQIEEFARTIFQDFGKFLPKKGH